MGKGSRPRTLAELRARIASDQRRLNRESARLGEQVAVAQQFSPLARARRGFKQRGGISGISTKAQLRLEVASRNLLGRLAHAAKGETKRQLHALRKELTGSPKSSPLHHPGTHRFLTMMVKNPRLSAQAKAKSAVTFLKKRK